MELNQVEAIRREQRLRTYEQGRLEHRRELERRRIRRLGEFRFPAGSQESITGRRTKVATRQGLLT